MADDVTECALTELVGHDGQHVVWDRYIRVHEYGPRGGNPHQHFPSGKSFRPKKMRSKMGKRGVLFSIEGLLGLLK